MSYPYKRTEKMRPTGIYTFSPICGDITVQTRNKRPKKRVWNEHKKIAHMRLRL